ncbi:Uma2 family endonuclease [Kitasatospora sp. MMS16-BH015]|uniref:Uma2 family endonuclease n=1 Tax=Kitasatospora sp. MMS16-BH015 TaxID=2018025 RepID=UPI0020C2DFDB|nr:Uma2 family endonuclease [Kitasatospora sp. MMS16-BH015]
MTVETDHAWADLLDTWRDLDVPEGWRAEIEEGQIVLVPPPNNGHNLIAGEVHRALLRCVPDEVGVYQTLGTQIPRLEKLCIPDLVVVDVAVLKTGRDDDPIDAADVLLAIEITSRSTARQDRTKKLWGYAHGPVPLYLLIDRFDQPGPTVTLFCEPSDGAYRQSLRTPFGKPVSLPEPFGVTLDTASFPAPS